MIEKPIEPHQFGSDYLSGPRAMLGALRQLDPFQTLGIPCWLSPMLLDDPFEPELPFAEND